MTLKVLLVSAEADPFAKVGGLADVIGSLPKALRNLGTDARVLMPAYGFIDHDQWNIEPLFNFTFEHHTDKTHVEVFTTTHNGVPFYFVRALPYFGEEQEVYGTWDRDVPRFVFFNQLTLAVAAELDARLGWFPDTFHVNDWHTALVPFLIESSRHYPLWQNVTTMITIHNMAYQGENVGGWLFQHGIPARHHPELVKRNLTDNMLAMALAYSDEITTVSPRYALEIQYPHAGYGLDELLRARINRVSGILNGIDTELWNPATDPQIVAHYNADNFTEHRIQNKRQLQADANLEVRDDVPIIGLVSRLVWQKGIDIAIPALRRLLLDTDVQFIALGTGEPELNQQLWRLGKDFHWRATTFLSYNAAVAQRIYAGADIFLMPSRYEPCGVGQMIAMRYGALPLVRETGGLADTVANYDNHEGEHGTGFVFSWEDSNAILDTLRWAIHTYHRRPNAWQNMQRRAMQTDFSWDKSAKQYIHLYQRAGERRQHHAR